MALSYNILARLNERGGRMNVVEITYDNSYTTGGLALSANSCGLNTITAVNGAPTGSGGYVPSYDRSAAKLLALYGDNNNAADGPLIEVPNATDLSTIKVILFVIGT